MPQLSDEQIEQIRAECLEKRPGPEITLWYKHVPDGAYDDLETRCRKFIARGFCYLVATSDWVDNPVANLRLPEWMREPWLTYPDLPPKPPKK